MTSRDPQRCCEAVRSALLAIAWLNIVKIIVIGVTLTKTVGDFNF